MNTKTHTYVAIDVAKESLQVQTPERCFGVSNDRTGIKKIIAESKRYENALIILEATGGYERLALEQFHAGLVACKLVNPALVRAFARSEGVKAKTDRIDAKMLLRFAQSKGLRPMPRPSAQEQKLSELMDRRTQLSGMLGEEKTRLQNSPKCVLTDIRSLIRILEGKIAKIEKQIQSIISNTEKLKHRSAIIQSVCGVGPVNTWTLLAHLPEITQLNRNQLVALVGLAPYNRDSGKMKGKRSIRGGRAKVRRALYMAALVASRFNPVIRDYMERLTQRGKPFKCAIVAAMRKLIIYIQSLLKNAQYAT
jgi:transposase